MRWKILMVAILLGSLSFSPVLAAPTATYLFDLLSVSPDDFPNFNIFVRVAGADRQLIRDLPASAFSIEEDGDLIPSGSVTLNTAGQLRDDYPLQLVIYIQDTDALRRSEDSYRQALMEFARQLRDNDRIYLFKHSDFPLEEEQIRNQLDLPLNRTQFIEELRDVRFARRRGGNIVGNFRQLLQVLEGHNRFNLALIACMIGNRHEEEFEKSQTYRLAAGRSVPVFSVSFEPPRRARQDAPADRDFLERTARFSGGRYFNKRMGDELPELYRSVADTLAGQYILTYESPNLNPQIVRRTFEVAVDHRGETNRQTRNEIFRRNDLERLIAGKRRAREQEIAAVTATAGERFRRAEETEDPGTAADLYSEAADLYRSIERIAIDARRYPSYEGPVPFDARARDAADSWGKSVQRELEFRVSELATRREWPAIIQLYRARAGDLEDILPRRLEPDTYHLVAVAMAETGRLEDAAGVLDQALDIKPGEPSYLILSARIALQNDDCPGVEAALEAISDSIPMDPELHREAGELAFRCSQFGRASHHLERAVGRYPELHGRLAVSLGESGRSEEAVGSYRQALEADPGDVEARLGLGRVLVEQPDRSGLEDREALRQGAEQLSRALDQGLLSAVQRAEALNLRGIALYQLGDWDRGVLDCARAVEIQPALADNHPVLR